MIVEESMKAECAELGLDVEWERFTDADGDADDDVVLHVAYLVAALRRIRRLYGQTSPRFERALGWANDGYDADAIMIRVDEEG